MNKTIIGFIAGQALQLLLLVVALKITYADSTMLFCIIGGAAATVILGAGVALDRIELAVKENEMEEAAPIPKEIKVSNDRIESDAPKTGPKSDSNAQHPEKKITLKLEGGSPLMAKTLEEAMK